MPKKFRQFDEFVKDKDRGKAPVKKIADYPGPIKNAPPGGGKPYAAGGQGGKASPGKVGSDWTDKGDKSLVYKPKTDQGMGDKKGSAKVDSVKEFVETTKGMSPAEFAKYLAETSGNAGEIHQAIHTVTKVLAANNYKVADLVAELKRGGLLADLIGASLAHNETYKHIAAAMGDAADGESTCRKLVRAMNEMVGPPMHHMGKGTLGMGDEGMDGPPPGGDPSMGKHGHPMDDGSGMHPDDMAIDDEELDDDMHGDDDEMSTPHDDDDFGIDDEDSDGMGDPGMGGPGGPPMGHNPHHGAGVGLHRQKMGMPQHGVDAPRPSMMARMMARESKSPAYANFLKALRG